MPGSLYVLMFVVLAILKVTGYTDISWWLVTASLWVPVAFYICFLVFAGIFVYVAKKLGKM